MALEDNAPQTTASAVDDNQIQPNDPLSQPDPSQQQSDSQPQPQQQAAPQQSQPTDQPPTMQDALSGSPSQPASPNLPPDNSSDTRPTYKPGLAGRLTGMIQGLVQGLASGGAIGAIEGGTQGAINPRIPAQRNTDQRTLHQLQMQSAQNQIKFQSYQAAKMQSDLAVQKIQLENLPAEIQQQRDAAGIDEMQKLQNMGFTPSMITKDDPQAHRASLEHMTDTQGAVPPMAYVHISGQLVGYNLAAPENSSASYQLVRQMAPVMALPDESFQAFNKLTPEQKIEMTKQAAQFWQPPADPQNIRGQISNYQSLKSTYMANHPDDTTTAAKYDRTIAYLQSAGNSFLQQDVQRKYLMDKAEQNAKISASSTDMSDSGIPAMLVNGTLDPTQLAKRNDVNYNQTLKSANEYSLRTTGKPFDIAQAQTDYKYANNATTKNTLNYLNSLTGQNNDGGNLQALVNLSNGISRTRFPGINDVAGWAKLETGNQQMASYHAAITEVSDQVAKILGGTGATSDAKLKQAQDLFRQGFSKDQIVGTATTLRDLLTNRKTEMIGSNRYLIKEYGAPGQGGSQRGSTQSGAPVATHTYDPTTGTVTPIQGGR